VIVMLVLALLLSSSLFRSKKFEIGWINSFARELGGTFCANVNNQ
jgi:hypothetical protein